MYKTICLTSNEHIVEDVSPMEHGGQRYERLIVPWRGERCPIIYLKEASKECLQKHLDQCALHLLPQFDGCQWDGLSRLAIQSECHNSTAVQ